MFVIQQSASASNDVVGVPMVAILSPTPTLLGGSSVPGTLRHLLTITPLWIARYASLEGYLPAGYIPAGWHCRTFWQYSDKVTPNPGGADTFNGDANGLERFAKGS
ncbi:uncharacterized protein VTP21DRAFT_7836 [Calcarisporiella thermophila]|uniref:uncharacterized protein n=1 Tax=Calcarisporiella thermophila TaxID=911321 RepID=UPI0037447C4D